MTTRRDEPFQTLGMWARAVEREVLRDHRRERWGRRLRDPLAVAVLALLATLCLVAWINLGG